MKTSLKKLQKIAAVKHDRKAQKHPQSLPLDDFAKATQDMNDMRDCYDRLLSGAAATANSVYEFSESLREMGDCLLEKTALNDDEESGKVLLMLGKAQFELQKLLDGYRSHIFSTITIPSESLLNELRIVEEMKKCCDGKRDIYDDLLKKQKEKGRLRNSKSECFTSPQLKEAYDEYDDEANVFVFRMKSLKQGQSHSFLTQASRHHAAQLYFFKNAVRSLEALEPHVKLIAEHHHIDCQFSGLKGNGHVIYGDDAESDGEGCSEDSSETHDDGELSSDYEHNVAPQEVATLKSSMEEIFRSSVENSFSFQRGARAISKSAPLFPEKKLDSAERMGQLGPSPSRKYTSYVLPTPDQTRSVGSWKVFNEAPPQTKNTDLDLSPSPADQKYEKLGENVKMSGPIILNTHAVLMERSKPPKPNRLPPPLSETLSFKQLDPNVASYAKKAKRQAFSGPLIGKQWPNNSNVTASGPIASSAFSLPYSDSLLRTPIPRPTSTPKLSSRNFVSSPKISELHELPRPPAHVAVGRSSNCGSLISKSHGLPTASISMASISVPVFPVPPLALSRSYSIPAGGPVDVALHVPLQGSQNLKMEDAISSPPFDPMSLRNIQSKSSTT